MQISNQDNLKDQKILRQEKLYYWRGIAIAFAILFILYFLQSLSYERIKSDESKYPSQFQEK